MQFLHIPALLHDFPKLVHIARIHVLRLPGNAVLLYSQDCFL